MQRPVVGRGDSATAAIEFRVSACESSEHDELHGVRRGWKGAEPFRRAFESSLACGRPEATEPFAEAPGEGGALVLELACDCRELGFVVPHRVECLLLDFEIAERRERGERALETAYYLRGRGRVERAGKLQSG